MGKAIKKMYTVFQVSPTRHLDDELAGRLQISANRFLYDLLETPTSYIGENPGKIFYELMVNPSYHNTELEILILVSCHGKKSANGNFKDRTYPAKDEFTRITAEMFWQQLKNAMKQPQLAGKRFTVLFAQCYGQLMADDLIALINSDTDQDIANLKARVKVAGLSRDKTHRTRLCQSEDIPIGAQLVHKEFTRWVLDHLAWNEDQWIEWFDHCISNGKKPAELAMEYVLSYLRQKISEQAWGDLVTNFILVRNCITDEEIKTRLIEGTSVPVGAEEEMEDE